MFQTVLVPLDGSRFAEAALPLAARLAKDAKARLHLLRVHEPAAALVSAGDAVFPSGEVAADLKHREEVYLAEIAGRLRAASGGPVAFREVEGAGGPDICEEAGRLNADLVVMATHGRGTFRRLWLGSVADYVVRHLSLPIILVHPDQSEEPRGERPLLGILVALDLSKASEAILEPVITLAQLTQAHVTLVHALDSLAVPSALAPHSTALQGLRFEAQRKLDGIADRLRERGLSVATRVTAGISRAEALLTALEEDRFDVIALTTHGAGGMRRLVLGSVADKVIRSAAKPVMVLRPTPVG